MDTTHTPTIEPSTAFRQRVQRVKVIFVVTALILLSIAGYLYATSGARLDREIFGDETNFAAEIASMPQEAQEVLLAERNRELLRRHAVFAAFGAVGIFLLLLALLTKRRILLAAVFALLLHAGASGLYLILAKKPDIEDSEKNFGGDGMTTEKKLVWTMVIIGFAGLLPATVIAMRRHTVTIGT